LIIKPERRGERATEREERSEQEAQGDAKREGSAISQ